MPQLPEDKRDVILLSYFLGMTDREISEKLNVVHQTVSKRRLTTLKELREYLMKEGFEWTDKICLHEISLVQADFYLFVRLTQSTNSHCKTGTVTFFYTFYFYVGSYLCHYAPRTFRSPTKTTLA